MSLSTWPGSIPIVSVCFQDGRAIISPTNIFPRGSPHERSFLSNQRSFFPWRSHRPFIWIPLANCLSRKAGHTPRKFIWHQQAPRLSTLGNPHHACSLPDRTTLLFCRETSRGLRNSGPPVHPHESSITPDAASVISLCGPAAIGLRLTCIRNP
jgi:hypothetical protein